jgi:hypothetical protein
MKKAMTLSHCRKTVAQMASGERSWIAWESVTVARDYTVFLRLDDEIRHASEKRFPVLVERLAEGFCIFLPWHPENHSFRREPQELDSKQRYAQVLEIMEQPQVQ